MRRVAVTGIGVVSPVGSGRDRFWDGLASGRSGIARISRFDCSGFAVRLAGEAADPPGLPPEVEAVAARDPKVGFAFAAAAEAMASAGLRRLGPGALLHLGTSLECFDLEGAVVDGAPDFERLAARRLAGSRRVLQVPLDTAAGLVAAAFGRPGRSLTNCSACAAGAQAIGHAFRAVAAGAFEVAVCGGFDSMINPLGVGGFQLLGALTVDGDRGPSACRPFDASRSGTVLGEGAAVLVLEPLERARADGRPVMAEVCGYGASLDANSLSAPDPEGDGAARAMAAALREAGLRPEQVAHINAHGTGTRLNDEVEAAAIRRVFAGCWERIPVSATKSVTGHLIGAAGAVEAVACLLPFARGVMPPNPWLTQVGRGCELDHVTGAARPFDGAYALSNSFGFGGQNASLVFGRGHG
jgi:3-oxoacyl-[acyl-carrier-protein] synthase II